jgi:hypothetical protein
VLVDEQDLREHLADRGWVNEPEEEHVFLRSQLDSFDPVVELEDGCIALEHHTPGLLPE